MDLLLVALVAGGASLLTFFSGFGLGTLLLPAFALFMPVPTAVAATAIVHLLNNLMKGGLLRARVDWPTVRRFGLPAVPGAIAGAWLLARLGATDRMFEWQVWGRAAGPTGAGLAVGLLLILFALIELRPRFGQLRAPPRALPVGGLVTGFLGGLTGQQGALRSIFLLRTGLTPDRFVATGVMIAILVDLARIGTYGTRFAAAGIDLSGRAGPLILAGTAAALAGAVIGARLIDKVTIAGIRSAVGALMLAIGVAMVAGLIGT